MLKFPNLAAVAILLIAGFMTSPASAQTAIGVEGNSSDLSVETDADQVDTSFDIDAFLENMVVEGVVLDEVTDVSDVKAARLTQSRYPRCPTCKVTRKVGNTYEGFCSQGKKAFRCRRAKG